MLNFLKSTQKKLEHAFNDKNLFQVNTTKNPQNNLVFINSQIIVWKKSEEDNEIDYESYFRKQLKQDYHLLNFTGIPIPNFKNDEIIITYKTPNLPSYTLQFILDFSFSIKEILDNNSRAIFVFYDFITSVRTFLYLIKIFFQPRILLLISTCVSFALSKNTNNPMSILATILSVSKILLTIKLI